MQAVELRENMYALILSAMTGCTPEQSFRYLSGLPARNNTDSDAPQRIVHKEITQQDVEDMARLKKMLTYKEIGEMYNMSAGSVYNRIRRLRGVI